VLLYYVAICMWEWLNPGSGEFLPPSLVRVLLPSLAPSDVHAVDCAWWISRVDLCQLCYCSHHWSEFFSAYFTFPCCPETYSKKIWLEAQLHSASGEKILTSSLVRVLLCWKRKYWLRSTELPTTCWKWNHLCSSHGILSRWKKYKGIV
jgi:hypothetical protein